MRVLLLADLLARTAELRNLQVLTAMVSDDQFSGLAALERAADRLGMHPATARLSPAEAQAALDGPIDVHLVTRGANHGGLTVPVGTARMREAGQPTGDLLAGHEHEPLAVRLALLSFPYHQPADLTEEVLAEARATVGHWRSLVAEWAESPSRPVPAPIAETARAAFDDLDTVAALALLRGLASDADVPVGARFETFLYADRILGLHLPRDIGRVSR